MRESEIQRECLVYLGTRLDLATARTNTGAAIGKRGLVRFGIKGMADIHCLQAPHGRLVAIEVKTRTGRQSKDQIRYERMIRKFGGVYICTHSVANLHEQLERELRCDQ